MRQTESKLEFFNLIEKIRSGVIHIQHLRQGKRINSGSGFFSNKYLITNNHVLPDEKVEEIILAWQPKKYVDSRQKLHYEKNAFMEFLKEGSPQYDFAILEIPELSDKGLHSFALEANPMESKNIGEDTIILGFPFEHCNLVCHTAIISSFDNKNSTNIIQLDGSVNNSNSGGPLVDTNTGNVLGIVTRKKTGLTEQFDALQKLFHESIQTLQPHINSIRLGNFRPIEHLQRIQIQMQQLSQEIHRSANVGIGYAFSSEYVFNAIENF